MNKVREPKRKSVKGKGFIRIIGGQWRGRKLPVPDSDGLRPTTDRVKETLFNWLQGRIASRRCLDLFAGSGSLSFEALSRQAGFVQSLELAKYVTVQLKKNSLSLGLTEEQFVIECVDTLDFLNRSPERPFDLVFIDPPFHQGLVGPCCQLLIHNGWLSPQCLVYVEQEQDAPELNIPWTLLKAKQAGQVCYQLYQVSGE
ncbi:MAG: Ribosomal RNA small subunit methyltransferase D [Candidatus Celerinatantimonas neptuna]|nr:MAG: Ribosomal RNA small subunit methyltransferase D [Candidatus Celerinatantimonas neptuna]